MLYELNVRADSGYQCHSLHSQQSSTPVAIGRSFHDTNGFFTATTQFSDHPKLGRVTA